MGDVTLQITLLAFRLPNLQKNQIAETQSKEEAGFMSAYCPNPLTNRNCHIENMKGSPCTLRVFIPMVSGTWIQLVFVNFFAENRLNRKRVGRKAHPLCPHIETILHLLQVFCLISISFRGIFISNSFRKIPTSNLVLYHRTIMSQHIFVQLLYLDSVHWIKHIIIQCICNFLSPSYMQYINAKQLAVLLSSLEGSKNVL